MKRLFVLAFTIILCYLENYDKKEKKHIELSRFIVEADGKKRDFYTFHKDIEMVLNAENIDVKYEDVLRIKESDSHCHIKVIRSNRGIGLKRES